MAWSAVAGLRLTGRNLRAIRPGADDPDTDIPWWRVVRSDGGLLGPHHEMTDHRREWVAWAKGRLVEEGVALTNDGRVASIAGRSKPSGGVGGARSRNAVDTSTPRCYRCLDRHAGFSSP